MADRLVGSVRELERPFPIEREVLPSLSHGTRTRDILPKPPGDLANASLYGDRTVVAVTAILSAVALLVPLGVIGWAAAVAPLGSSTLHAAAPYGGLLVGGLTGLAWAFYARRAPVGTSTRWLPAVLALAGLAAGHAMAAWLAGGKTANALLPVLGPSGATNLRHVALSVLVALGVLAWVGRGGRARSKD